MCRIINLCVVVFLICFMPLSVSALAEEEIGAEAAVLMEAETGTVLWQKNGEVPKPMASTTKLMTALVVAEQCRMEKTVTIPAECEGVEGSSLYLKQGEQWSVRDLLTGLLLESGNDAAVALAIQTAGDTDSFVQRMNQKAEELGLVQTHFCNPNGLPAEGHQTTAVELGKIAAELLKEPTLAEIIQMPTAVVTVSGQQRTLKNSNRLLTEYDGCIGMKTGFTKEAGRCLVSAAQRDGMTLICVTLHDKTDWEDHKKLLDCGFSGVKQWRSGELKWQIPVVGGIQDIVAAGLSQELRLYGMEDHWTEPVIDIELTKFCYAPICKGTNIGRVIVKEADGKRSSCPIIASENVGVPSQKFWIITYICKIFNNIILLFDKIIGII